MNITKLQKEDVQAKLKRYVTLFSSQNKAANSLKGVSTATISQILNGKWDLISDEMWRNISAQVEAADDCPNWVVVETTPYRFITEMLEDAQRNALVYAAILRAGRGKTQTIKSYAKTHKNVCHLKCAGYWNKKRLLQELLRVMGIANYGYSLGDLVDQITNQMKKTDCPIIPMDEIDKLSDEVLQFFIIFYNELEDQCGIVLFGTPYFQRRIERGVALGKRGYEEFYSRMCRNFVAIPDNDDEDLRNICIANGVTDELAVTEIVNDSEGDVRRIKRRVHAYKELTKEAKGA